MNIVDQAQAFAKCLQDMTNRSAWQWRRCPKCGDTDTAKYGTYARRLWCLGGRKTIVVQRHKCTLCSSAAGKTVTYSETSALRVRGSWYAREVHRLSVDHWLHGRSSLRRTAEFVRSMLGHQERWQMWRPQDQRPNRRAECRLGISTVHRWLDGAGRVAQGTVKGQLEGVGSSGQVGTDGLWAVLGGRGKRVVLALVDSVSGLIWPPVVVLGEEKESYWQALFERAQEAGLDLDGLRGLVSDGAQGLIGYLNKALVWVNHQRCVLHIWRNLAGELARKSCQAAQGRQGQGARVIRAQVRRELVGLVHGVIDAPSGIQGQVALAKLGAHPLGAGLARILEPHLDSLWVYLLDFNRGLLRVAPEWVWRDFRLRLSRGRNHGSEVRLERAALVWAIYHNFTPAQWRSERRRHYRHPGQSSLEVAGASPGEASYLDALEV
jgi:hypothetical protein